MMGAVAEWARAGPGEAVVFWASVAVALGVLWRKAVHPFARAIVRGAKAAFGFFRSVNEFLEQWFGQPSHGEKPAQLGVPARLTALESSMAIVKYQVLPNTGSSLRDELREVAEYGRATHALTEQVQADAQRVEDKLERQKQDVADRLSAQEEQARAERQRVLDAVVAVDHRLDETKDAAKAISIPPAVWDAIAVADREDDADGAV